MTSTESVETVNDSKPTKIEDESVETHENKVDGDGITEQAQSEQKEEAKLEINEQSMGQQYVGVSSSVRQTYDTQQASALFDLAME